jgi:hypothetical protein
MHGLCRALHLIPKLFRTLTTDSTDITDEEFVDILSVISVLSVVKNPAVWAT